MDTGKKVKNEEIMGLPGVEVGGSPITGEVAAGSRVPVGVRGRSVATAVNVAVGVGWSGTAVEVSVKTGEAVVGVVEVGEGVSPFQRW